MTEADLFVLAAILVLTFPLIITGGLFGYTYLREKYTEWREEKRRSVRSTLVSFLLPQSLYEIAESLCEDNYNESGVQWTVDDLCQHICREEFRRVWDNAPDFGSVKCCYPEPAHAAVPNCGDAVIIPTCVLPKGHEGDHLFNLNYASCKGCLHLPYKPAGKLRCGTEAPTYGRGCKEVMGGKPTWWIGVED